jgi:exonuclease SbcD
MISEGRLDPESGLPLRVVDYLAALDQIIDHAVAESADLVIFAGDAYRHQRPHPRFQQQWQSRIARLARAGIPTILLVGNHDTSPAARGAHALQEFATLAVPHIVVADRMALLGPEQLGCPAQVITLPWLSRSRVREDSDWLEAGDEALNVELEEFVARKVDRLIASADPDLPLILTAHATIQTAVYGSERQVLLGRDLALPKSLVADPRLDYVALGHIHKHQDLNAGAHPPVVYAGSIERIDFGEYADRKGFVQAQVQRGKTEWAFVPLRTRRFVDTEIALDNPDTFMADLLARLPDPDRVAGAICRLQLSYRRDHEPLLDEAQIARHYARAFSLQIARHRSAEKRSRLGDTVAVEALTPEELLATWWQSIGMEPVEAAEMQQLARAVLGDMLDL